MSIITISRGVMTMPNGKSRRHFTDAARAAAERARQLKRMNPVAKAPAEVYVVRTEATGTVFGWEIRRFGGIVVRKSMSTYPSIAAARRDGEQALFGSCEPESRP